MIIKSAQTIEKVIITTIKPGGVFVVENASTNTECLYMRLASTSDQFVAAVNLGTGNISKFNTTTTVIPCPKAELYPYGVPNANDDKSGKEVNDILNYPVRTRHLYVLQTSDGFRYYFICPKLNEIQQRQLEILAENNLNKIKAGEIKATNAPESRYGLIQLSEDIKKYLNEECGLPVTFFNIDRKFDA